MLYLLFSLVIAWLVYSIVSISVRYTKEQQAIIARVEKLEQMMREIRHD